MKRFMLCLLPAVLIAACASAPQSHYYTLSPAESKASANGMAAFAISIAPVDIPEQVDRPQIVLNDQGGTQVSLLNHSQWSAPLAEEIRGALAQNLSSRLGALELAPKDAPKTLPLWVFSVTVQRFESVYGDRAVLKATWRQTPRQGQQGETAVCSALITVPVQTGMIALVAGHQQALDELAGMMADGLGQQAAGQENSGLKSCV